VAQTVVYSGKDLPVIMYKCSKGTICLTLYGTKYTWYEMVYDTRLRQLALSQLN